MAGTMYYGRYGNEASYKLENILAKLEGATGVTLTSSGVAAISMALTAITKPGDHLLVADNVYGNTRNFCDVILAPYGVDIEYYDPMICVETRHCSTKYNCNHVRGSRLRNI